MTQNEKAPASGMNQKAVISGLNQNQKAVIGGLYTFATSVILVGLGLLAYAASNRPEVCGGTYYSSCSEGDMDKTGLIPLIIGAIMLLSVIVAHAQLPKPDFSAPDPK